MNVDLHSSWLVVNSVRGCTNGCKYCFLEDKLNVSKSRVSCTAKEVVQELLVYPFYDEKIPICLFPNTDIFLNESNIAYLMEVLAEFERLDIKNDLVIITKCLIPKYVLKYFQKLQKKGFRIVVYLSYSGLNRKFEPGVNHKDILNNFKMLKKYSIPCIHYFRPFILDNSSKKRIQKVLKEVHPYTSISVVSGLMIQNKEKENLRLLTGLTNVDMNMLNTSSSVYPASAWNYLFQEYLGSQFIFQTNTCALNMALEKICSMYFCSKECIFFNSCSRNMRMRCQRNMCQRDYSKLFQDISFYFKKLGIHESHSWNLSNHNTLQIIGQSLDSKILIYLSFVLGIKVMMSSQDKDLYYSSLHGRVFVYKEEI